MEKVSSVVLIQESAFWVKTYCAHVILFYSLKMFCINRVEFVFRIILGSRDSRVTFENGEEWKRKREEKRETAKQALASLIRFFSSQTESSSRIEASASLKFT